MKKFISLALASTMVLGLFSGCGQTDESTSTASTGTNAQSTAQSGESLVIYSPNTENMINTIIPLFEKETGVKVEVISMGSGEMFKRVQSEKENPNADVTYGGSFATYQNNLDLFEEYVAKDNADVMEEFQNKTGKVTLNCLDGSVILVNKDLVGDMKIEGYEDLLNPELKGKISTGDPASSSSAFAQLTNQLLAMGGDYNSDEGWDYVGNLLENTEGKVAQSSSSVHKSVADGENAVALTYEDPAVTYIKNGVTNLEVVYPVEGAVYLPAGAAIIKGAKNQENAEKFMDFLVSKTCQDVYGTQMTVRPVREDAELGTYMTPLADINVIYEDNDYIQQHKDEIVARYMDKYTDVTS